MSTDLSHDDLSVIWRRLDIPGHEAARIYTGEDGWYLDGSAVFLSEKGPCRLEYLVECDPEWRTNFATVDGFAGDEVIAIEIEVAEGDVWLMNGEPVPSVEGCTDIDLNFSPVTNLLPVKRLGLDIGEAIDVRAAWLRFPSFALEPLEQAYRRVSEFVYSYRSTTGFEADITVDRNGIAVEYAGLWIRER